MASNSNTSSPASSVWDPDSAESVSPVKRGRPSTRRGRGRGSRGGAMAATRGMRGRAVGDVRGQGASASRARTRKRGRGRLGTGQPAIHVETTTERKERIKLMISKMTEQGAKETLCQVVEKQPGVIFDILDRVAVGQGQPGYHPQPGNPTPQWCYCSHCREMPKVEERVCCGYLPEHCLSLSPDMERYVLDEGVLSIARMYRREVLVHPQEEDLNKANRHAAYRQFTLWCHGRLGAGVRLVIPSCCVWVIRDRYPDLFGQYTGFLSNRLA